MTQRILIASVLKPVNDARMYEKIGISLSGATGYEIHMAGYKSNVALRENIKAHVLFSKGRLHISRLFVNLKLLILLFKVKPSILIITTFELLPITPFYKLFFRGKVIYDVQENYFRNLVYTNSFPPVIKHILAVKVRCHEWFYRSFINQYLLAERNYENEFSFAKGKSTVIENKFKTINTDKVKTTEKKPGETRLLYTGTIAENYGIFEAIQLAKALHQIDSTITLLICGYAAKSTVYEKLLHEIKDCPFISLVGGKELVAHETIVAEIRNADFGLVSYRPNKSTDHCIPTKLFEYLACQLPVILPDNPIWKNLADQYQAGIVINYSQFNTLEIFSQMKSKQFYSQASVSNNELLWENEEAKLFKVISSL